MGFHRLKDFVDIIDTPGGHIFTAVILGVVGIGITAVAEYLKFVETAKAAALLTGFLSIAAYAMRGVERANGKDKKEKKEGNGEQS